MNFTTEVGAFLFYYQGSTGYDEEGETVSHRTIGVALSTDGVRFEKYHSNPVITFSPTGNLEEGAASSAAILNEAGEVDLYYGANTWIGGDRVSADVRRSHSPDGLRFRDLGIVVSHRDSAVWGSGDELFPLVAFEHGNEHFVYYVPNGTLQTGHLGLARMDSSGQWRTFPVRHARGPRPVEVWGPGSAVNVGNGIFAVFLVHNRPDTGYMEVRTVSVDDPTRFSRPVHRYKWDNIVPRSVLHDPEDGSWYLYYWNIEPDLYGVMVSGRDCG